MIENIRLGGKAVTCDNCGDGFEADDWESARMIMKEQGWKTKRVNGVYQHFCADCSEEEQ